MTSNDENTFVMDGIQLFSTNEEFLQFEQEKNNIKSSSSSLLLKEASVDSNSSDQDNSLFCSAGILEQTNVDLNRRTFSKDTATSKSTSASNVQRSNSESCTDHKRILAEYSTDQEMNNLESSPSSLTKNVTVDSNSSSDQANSFSSREILKQPDVDLNQAALSKDTTTTTVTIASKVQSSNSEGHTKDHKEVVAKNSSEQEINNIESSSSSLTKNVTVDSNSSSDQANSSFSSREILKQEINNIESSSLTKNVTVDSNSSSDQANSSFSSREILPDVDLDRAALSKDTTTTTTVTIASKVQSSNSEDHTKDHKEVVAKHSSDFISVETSRNKELSPKGNQLASELSVKKSVVLSKEQETNNIESSPPSASLTKDATVDSNSSCHQDNSLLSSRKILDQTGVDLGQRTSSKDTTTTTTTTTVTLASKVQRSNSEDHTEDLKKVVAKHSTEQETKNTESSSSSSSLTKDAAVDSNNSCHQDNSLFSSKEILTDVDKDQTIFSEDTATSAGNLASKVQRSNSEDRTDHKKVVAKHSTGFLSVETSPNIELSPKSSQLAIEHKLKKAVVVLPKEQATNIESSSSSSSSAKITTVDINSNDQDSAGISKRTNQITLSEDNATSPSTLASKVQRSNSEGPTDHKKGVAKHSTGFVSVVTSSNKELSSKSSQLSNEHSLKKAVVVLPKISEHIIKASQLIIIKNDTSCKGGKEGMIEGRNRVGRPRKRFVQQIVEDMGCRNCEEIKVLPVGQTAKISVSKDEVSAVHDVTRSIKERNKDVKKNECEVVKEKKLADADKSKIMTKIDPEVLKQLKVDVGEKETEVSFVQEKNLRKEADKSRETLTVEDGDSDADICIIKEDIKVKKRILAPIVKRSRGRPRKDLPRTGQERLTYLKNQFGSSVLKCSECSFKTTYLSQLKNHEAAHPKGRKMKCSKCTFETRIKSCMIYHAAMHAGGEKFKCSKCKFKTNSVEDFIAHENKKVICPYCKEDCHLNEDLKRHLKQSHNLELFHCTICGFSTLNEKERESHSHGNSFPLSPFKHKIKRGRKPRYNGDRFICSQCRYPAQSSVLLIEHINNVHGMSKKLGQRQDQSRSSLQMRDGKSGGNIDLNNKRFRGKKRTFKRKIINNNNFQDYRKTSFGEFICRKCSFVTDDIFCLENHLEIHSNNASVLHQNKDIFKCTFCEFETEYETMMGNHMETHTEQDSDFDFDLEKDSSFSKKESNVSGADGIGIVECIEAKKYRCSYCEFQTNYIKAFERHKSLHLRRDVFDIIFSPISS